MDALAELVKRRLEKKKERKDLENQEVKSVWLDPESYTDDSDDEYEKMIVESKARRKYIKNLADD